MRAKNKSIGDIYYNPMAMDFWFLNKVYYEDYKKEKWTLNLIHNDYQVLFAEVAGFIKVGNLFDLITSKIESIEYIKKHKRKDGFLNLNEWQTADLLKILGDDNNV